MFQEKAKYAQESGAIGILIIDNNEGSSVHTSPLFTMSGDPTVEDEVRIPVIFLFNKEGKDLESRAAYKGARVRMGRNPANPVIFMKDYLLGQKRYDTENEWMENKVLKISKKRDNVKFIFKVRENGDDEEIGAVKKAKVSLST